MTRKLVSSLFLCCLLALLPPRALASASQPELPIGCPRIDNCVTALSLPSGEPNAGITFVVHDLFFDGLLLLVSVAQVANDPGISVFEQDVYEMDPEQNVFVLGKDIDFDNGQIGAYCQVAAYDKDQHVIYNDGGDSSPCGKGLTQTDYFHLTPQHAQDTVKVVISCGVVDKVIREDETPAWQDIKLNVPLRQPDATQNVSITKNESPLPIEEVFVTQTDPYTGIYLYYASDDHGRSDPPFSLITDGLSEVIGETLDDPDRGMPYSYHLLRTTQTLTSLRVASQLTPGMMYEIDLQTGVIRQAE